MPEKIYNIEHVDNFYAKGNTEETPALQAPGAESMDEAIHAYLAAVHDKYNKLKTLLYYEEPKPFYDFYVCNTVVKSQLLQGNTYPTFTRIENATPAIFAEHSPYVILTAYGGMGKSMMMRHFLLSAVKDYAAYGKIPVFIQLKDYHGGDRADDLLNHIYDSTINNLSVLTVETFESLLKSGQCLLLLDGLDELSSVYQSDFETALSRFMDAYPSNQYVMSSRPFSDFVSFDRFTTLHLTAFSNEQALELVDKLVFRPDDPTVKEKFVTALKEKLFESHHSFVSNPLLLTIMLMTFDQIAEISPRMHIFYRDAYTVLAQRHDASKGAYKRQLHTRLSSDQFAEYFSEFCARSYTMEKYELTEDEAKEIFYSLAERKKHPEMDATAQDFLDDLCDNICLMFKESGKYHFTHRSFQEYFCAVFFSKQKDKSLERIGNFFERTRTHIFANQTFEMLYDMIPDKIDEYILMPFLDKLIDNCEKQDGFWTYLATMYPRLFFGIENGVSSMDAQDPKSFICTFITNQQDFSWRRSYVRDSFPIHEEFDESRYAMVDVGGGLEDMVDVDEIEQAYIDEHGMPEIVAYGYMFNVDSIRNQPDEFADMLEVLAAEDFPPRIEYEGLKKYREDLHSRFDEESENLFDFL